MFKIGKFYYRRDNNGKVYYFQCVNKNSNFVFMKDENSNIKEYNNSIAKVIFTKVSILKAKELPKLFMKG